MGDSETDLDREDPKTILFKGSRVTPRLVHWRLLSKCRNFSQNSPWNTWKMSNFFFFFTFVNIDSDFSGEAVFKVVPATSVITSQKGKFSGGWNGRQRRVNHQWLAPIGPPFWHGRYATLQIYLGTLLERPGAHYHMEDRHTAPEIRFCKKSFETNLTSATKI